MRLVEQAVRRVRSQERHGDNIEVAESDLIILFGFLLRLRELVLVLKDNHIGEERKERPGRRRPHADVDRLRDFPRLQKYTESLTSENHPRRIFAVVE